MKSLKELQVPAYDLMIGKPYINYDKKASEKEVLKNVIYECTKRMCLEMESTSRAVIDAILDHFNFTHYPITTPEEFPKLGKYIIDDYQFVAKHEEMPYLYMVDQAISWYKHRLQVKSILDEIIDNLKEVMSDVNQSIEIFADRYFDNEAIELVYAFKRGGAIQERENVIKELNVLKAKLTDGKCYGTRVITPTEKSRPFGSIIVDGQTNQEHYGIINMSQVADEKALYLTNQKHGHYLISFDLNQDFKIIQIVIIDSYFLNFYNYVNDKESLF